MGNTFKTEKKAAEVSKLTPKKEFVHLLDNDQTEIKRLDLSDLQDAVKVMRRCGFDVTEDEVSLIIKYGRSFGCYVNRMLIGVGLAWPTHYDPETKILSNNEANALYMEDPAVLLSYEGRGIRRILLSTRENDARERGYVYAITYVSEDLPKGSVDEHIKEASSQLEKLYLSEQYEFYKTERGLMALKKVK